MTEKQYDAIGKVADDYNTVIEQVARLKKSLHKMASAFATYGEYLRCQIDGVQADVVQANWPRTQSVNKSLPDPERAKKLLRELGEALVNEQQLKLRMKQRGLDKLIHD